MYASVNKTRIFFDIDGSGLVWGDNTNGIERPVMIMLPGGPAASHLHYKSPMHHFGVLTEIFQVVYIDWRGAGHSDPAPSETLTLDQSVEDVEAVREMLGIDRWVVLGASAGAVWALAYATRFPERITHLVVLHAPASCDGFGDTAEANARRAGVTDPEAIRLYRQFAGGELTAPVEEWAWSVRNTIVRTQQATYIDPDKHPEAIEEHQKRWDALEEKELLDELDVSRWYLNDFRNSYKVLEDCKKIACPTLIITGETDPVASPADARAIHEAIPGSELFIHSGGHMPQGDEHRPFYERIGDFFTRNGIDGSALSSMRS